MTAAGTMISVAIVEDEREIRQGLAALIQGTLGYRCVGEFGSVEAALAAMPHDPPDVALIDIGLPGLSGIEGVRLLRERLPKLLCLILTVFRDDERIFEALCAGACGYLLKSTPPAKLLEAIAEAALGGGPMSPEVARRVIDRLRARPATAESPLTPHETRLLKLLVEGHSYKTAAVELRSSYHTVCFHVRNIYEKLHVHSKSEAVSKALRGGLVR